MAYDEQLAGRIGAVLHSKNVSFDERKMFGGVAFMVDNKMCVGVVKDMLMGRIDPEIYEQSLKKDGCRPMDFTGRPMKGFVYVEPQVITTDDELLYWVQLCLDFNPKAKKSKSKK